MRTLKSLNHSDAAAFVAAVGWVFEGSPWVAERAWHRRPFASVDELHSAMVAEAAAATEGEQLALLRAHPELGATGARGASDIAEASRREQARAGLDAAGVADRERLASLNAEYRAKFGFPFLYAVKGSHPREILAALERRMASTREAERAEALRQVYRIARFRLEEYLT